MSAMLKKTSSTDGGRGCVSSSNGGRASSCGAVTGLAAVLVAGEHRGRVLLGMRRLRVQLPSTTTGGGSPIEFGVKNRDSQLALLSPVQRSPLSSPARNEVELADEDYTCVIDRRPNPKTIHIFDHRVVDGAADDRRCYCKKVLGQGNRGEEAFCSNQCRY